MAKEQPTSPPTISSSTHTKLPPLPSNSRISKRPLLHPPIASPRTSSSTQKIIYISSSTPFISSVKRVRTYLEEIEKRAAGPLTTSHGDRRLLKHIQAGVAKQNGGRKDGEGGEARGKRDEEVVIKGTGKAIEKVVRLAAWWGEQSDVVVEVRTGSVGAVDDVVLRDGEEGNGEEEGSRVRRVSCLEVGVRLR